MRIPTGLAVGCPWQNYRIIINGAVNAAASAAALQRDLGTLEAAFWHDWRYEQMAHANYHATLYACDGTTKAQQQEFNRFVAACKVDPARLAFLGVEPSQPDGPKTSVWAFGKAAKRARALLPNTPFALPGVVLNEAGWRWLGGYYILCEQGKALRPDAWQVDCFPASKQQLFDLVGDFNEWKVNAGMSVPTILREFAYGTDGYATMQSDLANRDIMDGARELLRAGVIQAAAWATSHWDSYPGPASNLLEADGRLTPLGRHFTGEL